MRLLTDPDLKSLSNAMAGLRAWYLENARPMPWRATRDPYAIWVSESMLQQTQVVTVIPYFERWMQAFPTVADLAAADEGKVLRLWQGLGYYSRARNLHRAAARVVDQFGGRVPRSLAEIATLPGVGPYTAAAVLSIAYGEPLAVYDGNVRRVLARVVALDAEIATAQTKALTALAQTLLDREHAADHNQAMMELGALVCSPKRPRCDQCPLANVCRAHALGLPDVYPRRKKKKPVPHKSLAVALVWRRGRLILDKQPYGGLLAGLWELPATEVVDARPGTMDRFLKARYGVGVSPLASIAPIKHAYTHLKVTLFAQHFTVDEVFDRLGEARSWRWIAPAQLTDYAISKATLKVLAASGSPSLSSLAEG